MDLVTIFVLLVLFQLKHFIADYPLQGKYMLGKFKEKGWQGPLFAHTGVHAIGTFLICLLFVNPLFALGLSVFDFVTHSIMDRVKASPKMLGRYEITDKKFWWSLGLDQGVHHLTHYAIIAMILL